MWGSMLVHVLSIIAFHVCRCVSNVCVCLFMSFSCLLMCVHDVGVFSCHIMSIYVSLSPPMLVHVCQCRSMSVDVGSRLIEFIWVFVRSCFVMFFFRICSDVHVWAFFHFFILLFGALGSCQFQDEYSCRVFPTLVQKMSRMCPNWGHF